MVAPPCDAGQAVPPFIAPPDPSNVETISDQSGPSQAQLGDFGGSNDSGGPGSDNTSAADWFGSDDGPTADGPSPFGDSTLQEASDGDGGLEDFGAFDNTGDADGSRTPSANDDSNSQSTPSSTPGSGGPDGNADPTNGALGDVANLDSQDNCSGSPCNGSDDPSLNGFPTISISSVQGPDANSGSGDDFGLTGTGDSGNTGDLSNNGMDTANGSGVSISGSPQSDSSDSDATSSAVYDDDLDGSSDQTGADAANVDPSRDSRIDNGFGASPIALPSPNPSSQTGISSVSNGPSSAGNNDAGGQINDPIQSDSSAASSGPLPISGGDPPAIGSSPPPSVAPSAGPSSASNNGAEGLNASGLPLSSGSGGANNGISGTGGPDGTSGIPVDASRVSVPGSGNGQSSNGSGDNSAPQTEVVAPTFSTGEGTGPANGGAPPTAGSDSDGDDDDGFGLGVQRNGLGGGDNTPPSSSTPNNQPPSSPTCAIPTGDLSGLAEVSIPDVLDLCSAASAHVLGGGSS